MPVAKTKKVVEKIHKSILHKVIKALAILFFTIWIVIGLFILLFIYANFKQGAFQGLFGGPPPQNAPQTQVPTETDLPGIGKVNIECVQNALPPESIQLLVTDGPATLSEEDNTALEPCIVEAAASEDNGN